MEARKHNMTADERTYIIPLRKAWENVPDYARAKKAVKVTKAFVMKHMKVESVSMGKYVHKKLMEHGRKNPPHKVEVKVWKDGEKVKFDLVGAPEEKKEEPTTKKKGKTLADKVKEAKETPKESEEKKEKEKVLQKPNIKKEKQVIEEKHLDKKAEQKTAHKESFPKDEKPTHEKKK